MQFLLDSALFSEAETVRQWGWVDGITTNPLLLAKSSLPPEETLRRLSSLTSGPVFYQVLSSDFEAMLEEARRAVAVLGDQLVLKILPTPAGFRLVSRLSDTVSCAVTAVFSPAQALVAESAGARFAIVYYHRSLSQLPEGAAARLVADCISALSHSETHLLAASIKSVEEALWLRLAGVEVLSLPFAVLSSLPGHPLSLKAGAEFSSGGVGL